MNYSILSGKGLIDENISSADFTIKVSFYPGLSEVQGTVAEVPMSDSMELLASNTTMILLTTALR